LEQQPYPAHGCSELTPAVRDPEGSPACSARDGLVRTGTADL